MRLDTTPTISALLVLAATLLVGWSLTLDTAEAEPRFWNGPDGFAYRRELNVTAPNFNVSYTNHQVPFTLQTQPLIAAGKMRSDCADLRVASDDGTLIPYWIESGCNSNVTRVWTEIPSLPGGATRRFYLYYGSPAASSASSVNDTFVKDSIRLEVASCPLFANFCVIDDHASADAARDLTPDRCAGSISGINYGYPCTLAAPGTSTQNLFASEYRFLFVPDVTGLWGFAVRADNFSELATSATDEMLTTSHVPIAESYTDDPGELYENVTLAAGAARWYSFVATETNGSEFQRVRLMRPAGGYQVLTTGNFPGMIFRRNYSVVEPTYAVSANDEGLPSVPLSLGVVPGPTGSRLDVSWSAPASNGGSGLIGYRVWTSSSSSGPWTFAVNTSSTSANLFVGVNVTRHVRVQAQTLHGTGVNATAVGTTWDTPGPVGSFQAAPGNRSATLTWTLPTWNGGEPIDGYRIQVPAGSVVWNTVATTTNGANTSFVVNGLANGTEYTFRVVAYNLAGDGDPSGGATVMPGARPDPPRALTATRGNGSVTLSWTPGFNGSHDLTGYHIWRGASAGTETLVATTSNGANTSFTVNGLANGQTYSFNVTTLNDLGQSASSNHVSAKPATVPLPPMLTTLTEGNGTIGLAWSMTGPAPTDGGEPITGYTLYEGSSPGSLAANGTAAGTSITLPRPNGATRYYQVRATNMLGTSGASNTLSGAAGAIPYPPSNLVVTSGNRTLSLSWDPPVDDGGRVVTHYLAHLRGPDVAPADEIVESVESYAFTGLTNGTSYDVWVTAVNVKGESASPGTRVAQPLPPRPDPPASLLASRGDGQVTLSWTKGYNSTPLTGYTIWMGTASGTQTPLATTSDGANTSFVVSGLANGQTYFFNLTARTAEGMSLSSNEASAKPATTPGTPGGIGIARGNRSATLTWSVPSSGGEPILGFDIYRVDGGTMLIAQTANGANTSFVVNGLANGVPATFHVRARNVVGASAPTSDVTTTPATVPLPPVLTSLAEGNGTLSLTWSMQGPSPTDGGEPITSFTLLEGTSPGSLSANGTFSAATGATTLARPNGQTRYYQLTATNAVGTSTPGNVLSGAPGTIPYPPTGLVVAAGNRTIAVSWSPPIDDGGRAITHYVARLLAPSSDPLDVIVGGTSHTFSGLTNGTSYGVSVRAVNGKGASEPTGVAFATPLPPRPDPPAGLVATRGNAQVTLTWAKGYNATPLTGYTIWMGTSSGTQTVLATTTNGANTSFVVNGLANGQTRFFNVTASTAQGMSFSSNEVSAKPATTPSVPGAIALARGNRSATLTWTTPADGGEPILGFDIYRVEGGPTLVAQTSNGANTSFVVNGLANGAPATFHVRARNVVGASVPTSDVTTTPAGVPFPPVLLTAVRGNTNVTLTWTHGATDGSAITGTRLLQGTSPGALAHVATASAASTSIVRTGLTNGQTYYFALEHASAVGIGNPSNVLSAKPATVPGTPGSFTATFGDERVTLAWTTPSDGGEPLAGYTLERGLSPSTLQPLATLGPSNTSFESLGLTNGVTYHFRLSASNVVGSGSATAVRDATPGRAPDAPQDLTAAAGDGQVSLAWSPTPYAGGRPLLGYSLFRAAGDGPTVFLDDIGTNTSYLADGLTNGVTYRFEVSARNALGHSPRVGASALPLTAPGAPQGLQATVFQPQVTLSWAPPEEDGGAPIEQYRLYASETPGGPHSLVGVVDGSTFQLVHEPPAGSVLHYVARAFHVAGEGPASEEAIGATPADPLAPTLPDTYRSCIRDATTQTATCTPGSSERVVAAATGARHTCALLESGRVDCYGDDASGQSADHLAGQPATALAAGGMHTCALLDNGNVDCWGDNGFGRADPYLGGDAIAVATGAGHTCFLTLDGAALCQGANAYGQATGRPYGVVAIATGGHHTCLLLTDGDVTCDGLGTDGQTVGDAGGDVATITAGGFHTCALTFSATVRCWGDLAPVPSGVQGLAQQIASGADHACALLTDGNVVCWGATRDGQSEGYAGGDAIRVYAGASHSCVLTANAELRCWGAEGASDHGQATAYAGTTGTPPLPDPSPFAGAAPSTITALPRKEEA